MGAVAKLINQPLPDSAIDTEHLSRMTLGELSLQREVLTLFDRQAAVLLPRIRTGAPAVAAASVHTLKGSAVGIGAFKVARGCGAGRTGAGGGERVCDRHPGCGSQGSPGRDRKSAALPGLASVRPTR